MTAEVNITHISLRVVLGAIFMWAGTMKVLDLDWFVETVGYFEISPFNAAPWDMWLGYMLPVFEILVGAALILGILLRGAMLSVLVLTVGFLVAVISAEMRGLNIECGCFGKALSFENYFVHIAVLVVMALMALVLVILEMRGQVRDQKRLA
ncbi:MAG: DoxX family protein [Akkermansiaceae bacterium]